MRTFESMSSGFEHRDQGREERAIEACLAKHVVDIQPKWFGSKEMIRQVGTGGFLGAIDASVHRTDPPIKVDRLVIEGGKSLALFGPNGSGKSTLFDAMMSRGNASFDEGTHGYNQGVHGKESLRIARLDQEELLSDVGDLKAGDVLRKAAEYYKAQFPVNWEDGNAYDRNLRNQDAEVRIETLVNQVTTLFEMEGFLDRKVSELSGGERTKMSLLMLLASEPDVLLLDEPTNHLDLESVAKVVGLIDEYKRAGVAVVSVSHVDWFLDMAGQDGSVELQNDSKGRRVTFSNSPHAKFKRRTSEKPLLREPVLWEVAGKMSSGTVFTTGERISVPNSPLTNVEVPTVRQGDITVFSGKNGTGKTKFMEQIADRHSKIVEKEKGRQIAYLPQFWPEGVSKGSVQTFFDWIKSETNPHSDRQSSRFLKALRESGFVGAEEKMLSKSLASFSGGEQRLLWFVATSILEGTDTLLLDEPTNHMDQVTMEMVMQAIRDFPGSVLLSTHDLRLMEGLERDPGKSRQGTPVTNITFERTGQMSSIKLSRQKPSDQARAMIDASRTAASRVRVR